MKKLAFFSVGQMYVRDMDVFRNVDGGLWQQGGFFLRTESLTLIRVMRPFHGDNAKDLYKMDSWERPYLGKTFNDHAWGDWVEP